MIVAVCQAKLEFFEKKNNWGKVLAMTDVAVKNGANIVVLPEASNTGYPVLDGRIAMPEIKSALFQLADEIECRELEALEKISSGGACVIVGLVLRDEKKCIRNSMVTLLPNGSRIVYYKVHLYHHKDRDERQIFTPGTGLGVVTLEAQQHPRLGLCLCYDLAFPELVRALVLKGCDVVAVAAAWPDFAESVWKVFLQSRALENTVFVIGSNQVGNGFCGESAIVSYSGEFLVGGGKEERVLYAEIDLDKLKKWRKFVSYLSDRREDIYGAPRG